MHSVPGRPRRPETEDAILDAALHVIEWEGYANLGFERVARISGVAKATIYRRYACRGELAADVLLREAQRRWPPTEKMYSPESYVRNVFSAVNGLAPGLKGLMADAQLDERFTSSFRSRFIAQRREALKKVLAHDARFLRLSEGQLDLAADLVFGPMWYRLLVGHAAVDDHLAEQLVELIVQWSDMQALHYAPSGPTSSRLGKR